MTPWLNSLRHMHPASFSRLTKAIFALEAKIVELAPFSKVTLSDDAEGEDDEDIMDVSSMSATRESAKPQQDEAARIVQKPGVSFI
jgi:hypothetical protein